MDRADALEMSLGWLIVPVVVVLAAASTVTYDSFVA